MDQKSKSDIDQTAKLLLVPGSPSYNNNKHSTSLRYPIRITIIEQTVLSITKPKKKEARK